jgi:hypothetical protein
MYGTMFWLNGKKVLKNDFELKNMIKWYDSLLFATLW